MNALRNGIRLGKEEQNSLLFICLLLVFICDLYLVL
jgi:hypothetical protein